MSPPRFGGSYFFSFSRQKGQEELWEEVIYPGMRQAIVYTLESCQLSLEARKVSCLCPVTSIYTSLV